MSKDIIFKTLRHEDAERIPWVPFVGVYAGKLIGCPADELLQDADKLFNGIMEACKLFDPDGMPVLFDLQLEAEILGCDLKWAKEAPPCVSTHPLENTDEIPCDCALPRETDGRLPVVLDVMRRVKKAVGDKIALYGLICGPFTLASHLRGNNIFTDMYDDEDYVNALLEYCAKVCKRVADFYIEAGMDVIAIVDPVISQISPSAFGDFMSKPFSDIFEHIREKNVFSSFFVCGNATRNIELMCLAKPDSIAVDENVDMVSAKAVTDRYDIALSGNIPLTTTMLHGTQQDNIKYVVESLADKLSHKNLIISPGCDMPYNVPVENTIAAGQAARRPDAYRAVIADYQSESLAGIPVVIPDYASLTKPFIEVFTLDSESCAACGYMMEAVNVIKAEFGDAVDVIEYKYTIKENIARCIKMGVTNLPAIYINGKLQYSSIIPNRAEFADKIKALLK